jgi:hypothetical protein
MGGIDNTIKNVEEKEKERGPIALYIEERKKTPSAEYEKF